MNVVPHSTVNTNPEVVGLWRIFHGADQNIIFIRMYRAQ